MRGTAGEHAHTLVTAQTRRTHGRLPFALFNPIKLKNQPNMTERLQTAYGFGQVVGRQ